MLADRYFLRRLVGEGAMGRVYEGHHTGIGKRVAIKIPRHGERRKRELVQRFRLEAQAASQIRHPNIADVTDCGTTPDGRFFFVMEFIDGIDVVHLVRQENPLPVERALLIAVQVCRALEAAHKAGIIHRDLKPSNVMLLRDRAHEDADFVKVLDFGVAKFLRADPAQHGGQLTQVDAAVGTPKYMAPEQIERGNDIDFRVDIYAVGGLLYFMLTGGHPPTEGDSVEAVWRKKMTEEALPAAPLAHGPVPGHRGAGRPLPGPRAARRPSSMEILRKDLLAAIERLRAVGVSAVVRAPSVTSLVHDADRRAQRRNRAAMLVLGIGGTVAGVTALVVDRAVGPDRHPRLRWPRRPGASPHGRTAPRDRPAEAQPTPPVRPPTTGSSPRSTPAAAATGPAPSRSAVASATTVRVARRRPRRSAARKASQRSAGPRPPGEPRTLAPAPPCCSPRARTRFQEVRSSRPSPRPRRPSPREPAPRAGSSSARSTGPCRTIRRPCWPTTRRSSSRPATRAPGTGSRRRPRPGLGRPNEPRRPLRTGRTARGCPTPMRELGRRAGRGPGALAPGQQQDHAGGPARRPPPAAAIPPMSASFHFGSAAGSGSSRSGELAHVAGA